jgi:thioredoxin 1
MRFPVMSVVVLSCLFGVVGPAAAEKHNMMKEEMMKEEMMAMASFKPYTAEAFKAAQMAGQPVVIHVHKDGCPTCAAQEVAFQDILKSDKLADVAFLRVNYKGQPEIVKELGAKMQSTLIVYGKDGKELSRTAGETDATKLKAQIEAVGATM